LASGCPCVVPANGSGPVALITRASSMRGRWSSGHTGERTLCHGRCYRARDDTSARSSGNSPRGKLASRSEDLHQTSPAKIGNAPDFFEQRSYTSIASRCGRRCR
jgi:hypothetical protein